MNDELQQEISQLHAQICAGLADPTRILLLYELADGPHNVTQLSRALEINQPAVSRHLKVLRERGMVTANRLGSTIEYRLGDARLIRAMDLLRDVLRDGLAHRALVFNAFAEN
jgi:DNA-binding transcriptional ArsR family regulator